MARHVFWDAKSFVWQLVVNHIARGYWFYVTGWIPEGKDPLKVDAKLKERFQISDSKWVRYRRKQKGESNVAYLRQGRFFLLLATKGEHPFWELEPDIRDFRRRSLQIHGLRIGGRRNRQGDWKVSIKPTSEAGEEILFEWKRHPRKNAKVP